MKLIKRRVRQVNIQMDGANVVDASADMVTLEVLEYDDGHRTLLLPFPSVVRPGC